jgi:hypothetical protein
MVHFPPLSSTAYGFSRGSLGINQEGFPHSGIPGSKPVCGSPTGLSQLTTPFIDF